MNEGISKSNGKYGILLRTHRWRSNGQQFCGRSDHRDSVRNHHDVEWHHAGRADCMRVYLSGPITGRDDYRERFATIEHYLTELEHEVINPTKVSDAFPDLSYGEYMKIDLTLLEMCDAIYMLEDWEQSAGAQLEFHYAKVWKKQILRY